MATPNATTESPKTEVAAAAAGVLPVNLSPVSDAASAEFELQIKSTDFIGGPVSGAGENLGSPFPNPVKKRLRFEKPALTTNDLELDAEVKIKKEESDVKYFPGTTLVDYHQTKREREEKEKLALLKMDSLFSNAANENEIARRRLVIDGDGTGDEKKLFKLVELYSKLISDKGDKESDAAILQEIMDQIGHLRLAAKKTSMAISINEKAAIYWKELQDRMRKEMDELRSLIKGQREMVAQRNKLEKERLESETMKKGFEGSIERPVLEEKIADLTREIDDLKTKATEQDVMINSKKVYLNGIVDLVKRLADDDDSVKEDAVSEAEEKVLSDVSLEMDTGMDID